MNSIGSTRAGKWLMFPRDGSGIDAPVRMLCFHHAGGGASMFHRWPALLGHVAEVVAVQLPGREGRFNEPFVTDAEALLAILLDQASLLRDRPTVLFGHSLGALVAHELALRLQREEPGLQPAALVVSGQRPPRFRKAHPPGARRSDLPTPALLDLVTSYAGTPREILQNAELLEIIVPLLRNDFRLAESLSAITGAGKLTLPVLVLGGEADPIVPACELPAWADVTAGPARICLIPGGHFFVKEAGGQVVRVVEAFLSRVISKGRK